MPDSSEIDEQEKEDEPVDAATPGGDRSEPAPESSAGASSQPTEKAPLWQPDGEDESRTAEGAETAPVWQPDFEEESWSAEGALPEGSDEREQTSTATLEPAGAALAAREETIPATQADATAEAVAAPAAAPPEAEEEAAKRSWVPWLVGIPLVIAIAVVAAFLIRDLTGGGRGEDDPRDPTLHIKQAGWDIRSYVIGGRYVRGAPEQPPVAASRALAAVVTNFHEALLLKPSRLDEVVKKYFTEGAARALRDSKVGIPKNAEEVRTTRRFARIGIDAAGASRAAVLVELAARGKAGSRRFKSAVESRLWLEKTGSGWKVIAYQLDQSPGDPFGEPRDKAKRDGAKKGAGGGKSERGKRGDGKRGGGKGGGEQK